MENITYVKLKYGGECAGVLQLFNRKGRPPNSQDLTKAEAVAPILTSFISLTQQLHDAQNYLSKIQNSLKTWQRSDAGESVNRLLPID